MNNLIKRITLLSILIFVSIFLVSCKNNRKDYLFNEMKSYEFSRTSSKDSIYHSDIVVLNESYNYILTDSLENTYYYRDFGSKTYEYKENNRGITSKEVTLDFSYINEAITNIKYSDLDKISDYEYDFKDLVSYNVFLSLFKEMPNLDINLYDAYRIGNLKFNTKKLTLNDDKNISSIELSYTFNNSETFILFSFDHINDTKVEFLKEELSDLNKNYSYFFSISDPIFSLSIKGYGVIKFQIFSKLKDVNNLCDYFIYLKKNNAYSKLTLVNENSSYIRINGNNNKVIKDKDIIKSISPLVDSSRGIVSLIYDNKNEEFTKDFVFIMNDQTITNLGDYSLIPIGGIIEGFEFIDLLSDDELNFTLSLTYELNNYDYKKPTFK